MNAMISPALPYIPYNKIPAKTDGIEIICAALLLIGTIITAWCLGAYAAKHFGGNKKKTTLTFAGITGLVTLALLCFFGCAAITIRGIVFTLILTFSSYSDIRTRECADYLHLMIVIAAFTATLPSSTDTMYRSLTCEIPHAQTATISCTL